MAALNLALFIAFSVLAVQHCRRRYKPRHRTVTLLLAVTALGSLIDALDRIWA